VGNGSSPSRRAATGAGAPLPLGRAVGSDYFATMGTRLLRGRLFQRGGSFHHPLIVAIIDESTAKQYFPDGTGLDACVHLDSQETCTEIVGVVANHGALGSHG
jgi:hypothetical protein